MLNRLLNNLFLYLMRKINEFVQIIKRYQFLEMSEKLVAFGVHCSISYSYREHFLLETFAQVMFTLIFEQLHTNYGCLICAHKAEFLSSHLGNIKFKH